MNYLEVDIGIPILVQPLGYQATFIYTNADEALEALINC